MSITKCLVKYEGADPGVGKERGTNMPVVEGARIPLLCSWHLLVD